MDDMAHSMMASDAGVAGEIGQPSVDDGAKRRQVMEGAREIFMSAGFDAASMNDIARAAGVSKGTLYAYFDSKVALFEALIREDRAHQPERNMMFPADEPDPAKALAIYGRVLVAHVTRPEALTQARVVVAAAGKFPRLGQAFYEAGPLFGVLKLKDRLDAFVAAGLLTIANTTLAARLFIDMCTGDFIKRLLFMVDEKIPQEEIDAAVDRSVAIFINACSAPPRG
jgi:AcrR family transcriptional regulator